MKRLFPFLFSLCIFASFSSRAEYSDAENENILSLDEKKVFLASHDKAFLVFNERIRDPFILKGPDDHYYLTGTTAGSHWGETIGIRLWRSANLIEWQDLGFVWDLYKDGKSQGSWHFDQPLRNPDFKNPRAIWAPEVHYLNGTWWLPHCMNIGGHGLLKSVSGKPEGPYQALPPIQKRLIDAHLYQENGETYYLWQADWYAKMDDEMLGLIDEPRQFAHDGKHPMGYEGVLLLKIGAKYVFVASGRYGYEPTNTYDLYYAVSDTLEGPYGKRRMAIKNAGHGNLFQDHEGRWWSTAFDHEYIHPGNPKRWNVWLVPIEIQETHRDVLFHVKDSRFRPNEEDHAFVKHLARAGIPKEWEGKSPWWRPENE